MGNGVMAIGPQLPRPSSTLPSRTTRLTFRLSAIGWSSEIANCRRKAKSPLGTQPSGGGGSSRFLS